MKLTNAVVKQFERDQQKNGSRTAIYNLLWVNAVGQLNDIGVKRVRTTDYPLGSPKRKKSPKRGT